MLAAFLGRDQEQRVMANPWGVWPGDNEGPTWSGATVNTTSALQLLTVYGCNRFISDGIATLPVDRLRDSDQGPQHLAQPGWIVDPTPGLDTIGWLTQILTSLLLAGNAYLWLEYDGSGLVYLTPLNPAKVQVTRERGRKTFMVDGEPYDSNRVLHVPGVMLPGTDIGMSPLEAARQSIGMGIAAQEFGARFFGQGAVLSGVIEDPNPLDPVKARETARIWGRLHNGKDKAHLPGVLQGGATWKPTGVTNEQAQFLETRGYTASEIAGQMFLIDPTELGLPAMSGSTLTYQNLEQRNARKVQVTYLPWIVRLEKAFSALLPRPQYIKFNVAGLLRGDTLARYQAHSIGIQNEFLLPNEARALEDLPPLPGGDTVISNPSPGGNPPGGAK